MRIFLLTRVVRTTSLKHGRTAVALSGDRTNQGIIRKSDPVAHAERLPERLSRRKRSGCSPDRLDCRFYILDCRFYI